MVLMSAKECAGTIDMPVVRHYSRPIFWHIQRGRRIQLSLDDDTPRTEGIHRPCGRQSLLKKACAGREIEVGSGVTQ